MVNCKNTVLGILAKILQKDLSEGVCITMGKKINIALRITMNRLSHQRSLRLHNRYWRKEEERRDSELMANVRS